MNKRQRCETCLRPQSACLCRWVTPVPHAVDVLILQHPLEADNPKGTARLLHLSLPHSRLRIGELLEPVDWQPADSARHTLLLYPDLPSDRAAGLPAPPAADPGLLQNPTQLRLIVLDGTWRKTRRMLHLNPALQQLPRLSLQHLPASNYHIRRARRPDQLSTLEAVCAALAQLEGDSGQFQPLLKAFDGFVAQQLVFAGHRPEL